jgi:hypothetical protein
MTIRTLLFSGTTAIALGVASLAGAQDMNRSGNTGSSTNSEMNRGGAAAPQTDMNRSGNTGARGATEMNRGSTNAPGAANTGAANRAGSADAGTLAAAENGDMMVQPFNRSVDDIEGMDVVGVNNQKIGDVENVLLDSSGQATALSIEAGGFLGIGARQVIVQISDLTLQDDRLVSKMSKEQVSGLPEWND